MRKTFRSPASVNRELATLSGIFRLAIEYDELEANPCRKVQFLQEKNSRERYLTFEEEAKLIEQLQGCREHLRPIVICALYTGMRRGELLRLRWSKVDFEREIITVTETKTNRDRTVPMESIVNDVLRELKVWGSHPEDFVFPSHYTGSSFKDISRSFKTACKEAGIHDFRFHDHGIPSQAVLWTRALMWSRLKSCWATEASSPRCATCTRTIRANGRQSQS
ncbi:MAG: hypothetical protein DMF68_07070 [Acidobacteria bacterium]|nr:MAG: hypothetical protein DMF68_07070 [Acidobacteriota bacterium]